MKLKLNTIRDRTKTKTQSGKPAKWLIFPSVFKTEIMVTSHIINQIWR